MTIEKSTLLERPANFGFQLLNKIKLLTERVLLPATSAQRFADVRLHFAEIYGLERCLKNRLMLKFCRKSVVNSAIPANDT